MNTTKASPHETDRKTAAVVGVLFILGTVPALLSLPLNWLCLVQVAVRLIAGHHGDWRMSDALNPENDPCLPVLYQIRVQGHLGSQWTDWFGGPDHHAGRRTSDARS